MKDRIDIWNNAQEAMTAFTPFYQQTAVARIREAGALDSWFVLLQAAAVDPAPLSEERLAAAAPYHAPAALAARIEKALEDGFLSAAKGSGFSLTDKGRAVLAAFFDTAHALIAEAPALPAAQMERAAAYLARITTATELLQTPEAKINLAGSRWTDPGSEAAVNVRLDQSVTDLLAFRDDAHMAAWQATGTDGRTWEALTFVWRDQARTAAELAELLPRRGWPEQAYAASLDALGQRGWLEEEDGGWRITEQGLAVREAAESETDRLFFAGWDALDEAELQDLGDLLARLQSHLKAAAPGEYAA